MPRSTTTSGGARAPRRRRPPVRGAATSAPLRQLLREIEHSGSGGAAFWDLFHASVARLSQDDLVRLVLAVGARGPAHLQALRADRLRQR
jgi:hypothetical protein